MPTETTTPNIGLQVPAFNQPNWQVPIQYDLNILDLIFGGEIEVPALYVGTLTAGNAGNFILPPFSAVVPVGAIPGVIYTLAHTPNILLGVFWNGLIQRFGIDYTLTGNIITLNTSTSLGDTVYAVYFFGT
jgi:hypothetical protein